MSLCDKTLNKILFFSQGSDPLLTCLYSNVSCFIISYQDLKNLNYLKWLFVETDTVKADPICEIRVKEPSGAEINRFNTINPLLERYIAL